MLLRDSLAARDQMLFNRLQVVETKARQLLEYSQGGVHLTFTPHGLSHISAVEQNYDWLLSEADIRSLNPYESFCLLCATFFHDAFMIPLRMGDEVRSRTEHASQARTFLDRFRDLMGLTLHEVAAISEVIRAHSVTDFAEIQQEQALGNSLIDLRKMGAILSLSDICHADSSRAPEIVFRYLDMDEESSRHWRRHLQISGITRKNDRILMSAIYFSDEGLQALTDYKKFIEQELDIIRPYFHSILSPITGVDLQSQKYKSQLDIPLRFQANTQAILDILIEGVYQRSDVFLRELVQNSLDACHIRIAKMMKRSERYLPQVVITMMEANGIVKGIRVDDNGVGMDIADVQDTVLWIGNSI